MWPKQNNIRIVGKPLGRPPKQQLNAHQKRKLKHEQNQRNHIEGKFGQAKNAYGLSDIKAKRSDTSQSWIGAIFFIMNLITLTKIADIYAIFCAFIKKQRFCGLLLKTDSCFSTVFISDLYKYQNHKLKVLWKSASPIYKTCYPSHTKIFLVAFYIMHYFLKYSWLYSMLI